MWRRIYLVLLIFRLYFALSPSYLHPDENFQGPEVVAGKLKSLRAHAWCSSWFIHRTSVFLSRSSYMGIYIKPSHTKHFPVMACLWHSDVDTTVFMERVVDWHVTSICGVLDVENTHVHFELRSGGLGFTGIGHISSAKANRCLVDSIVLCHLDISDAYIFQCYRDLGCVVESGDNTTYHG